MGIQIVEYSSDRTLADCPFPIKKLVAPSGFTFTSTPNASFEIIIVKAGSFRKSENPMEHASSVFLVGPSDKRSTFTAKGYFECIHIRLQPDQAHLLFNFPLNEAFDRIIDLTELWGDDAIELLELVAGERDSFQIFGAIHSLLVRKKQSKSEPHILSYFKKQGTYPTFCMVKRNFSERHMQRLFLSHVGLPARKYFKIQRFQRAALSYQANKSVRLKLATPLFLNLALEGGYYDHAHFIRDCRDLTGLSPTEYFPQADHSLSGTYNFKLN